MGKVSEGMRFGKLVVKECFVKNHRGYSICICDCESTVTVRSDSLSSGRTRSCGCLSSEVNRQEHTLHGDYKQRLYRIYHKMKARCYNPKNSRFYRYGGRGIKICEEWLDDYNAFKKWAMSNGYKDSLSIDRKDNDGDYTPDNCRWADSQTQANNTSRNRLIEYQGEIKTVMEWCEKLNYPYRSTLRMLVDEGRSVEEVFTRPHKGKGFTSTH